MEYMTIDEFNWSKLNNKKLIYHNKYPLLSGGEEAGNTTGMPLLRRSLRLLTTLTKEHHKPQTIPTTTRNYKLHATTT